MKTDDTLHLAARRPRGDVALPRTPPAHLGVIPHYPGLDGLRALSIVGVISGHLGLKFSGYFGVTVFFVISGFLITSILLTELTDADGLDIRRFYRRRFARLAPALVVCILVSVIWLLCIRFDFASWWLGALGALTYITDITLSIDGSRHVSDYFEWSWSLGVEEQFYLVWPMVLLWVWRARRRRQLMTWLCVAVVVGAWVSRMLLVRSRAPHERIFYGIDTHMDAIALGALLAVGVVAHVTIVTRVRPMVWSAIGWVGAVGLLVLVVKPGVLGVSGALDRDRFGVAAICAFLVVGSVVCNGRSVFATTISMPLLRYIGRRSYGLYLWNLLVVAMFGRIWSAKPVDSPWLLIAVVMSILLVSEISYRVVEVPLRKRWSGRPR